MPGFELLSGSWKEMADNDGRCSDECGQKLSSLDKAKRMLKAKNLAGRQANKTWEC